MNLAELRDLNGRRGNAATAAHRAKDQETMKRHSIAASADATALFDGLIDAVENVGEEMDAREVRTANANVARIAAGVPSGSRSEAFYLPTIREYKAADLNETTDSQGGYLVPAQQAKTFFDMLRAQSVVLKAAPRVLPMSGEVLNVPQILTSTSTGWFAENASISSTEMTFDSVTLTAKKLAAYTELSNEVLSDSTPAIRDVIAYDFTQAMAAGLDLALLEGDGSGASPTGMRNFASVGETHAGTSGASVTLNMILDQIARVEAANGNTATAAFFMHPRTWSDIVAAMDDQGRYMMTFDPSSGAMRRLFGIPVYTSSQISVIEEVGSSGAACSYILLADMAQVAIGRRQDLALKYSDQFKFDTDQTAVRATSRWDIQPINVAAVDVLDGITS
mgnify:FL=1